MMLLDLLVRIRANLLFFTTKMVFINIAKPRILITEVTTPIFHMIILYNASLHAPHHGNLVEAVQWFKEVKKIVDDVAKYTDWSQRHDVKAELKVDLILLLGENGYPPVDRDEVYQEIFVQAENFKKNRGKE